MQIQASSRVQENRSLHRGEDRGGSPQRRQNSPPTESVLKEDVTPIVGVKASPAPSLKVEASPKADNSQRENEMTAAKIQNMTALAQTKAGIEDAKEAAKIARESKRPQK